MSNVLVFGHQNPDNDAIMSAVVLSQLLNQVNYNGDTYQACCLGPLPAESAKLLADAGIDDDDTESDDESELPAQEAQDGASSVVEPATGESDADQPQDDSTEPASDED